MKVVPVPGISTSELQQLIDALLYMQQHQTNTTSSSSSSSNGSSNGGSSRGQVITGLVLVDRAVKELQLVAAARRVLLPALRGGNTACGGR